MRASVDHISNQPQTSHGKKNIWYILLWSVLILSSNWLRVEIDRGLITVVFAIIVVTRETVGDKINRVGLAILESLINLEREKEEILIKDISEHLYVKENNTMKRPVV